MPDHSIPFISLADYETAAGGLLDAVALGYFTGGAGDETTMQDNRAAWGRLALRPRMLVGVGQRDTGVTVLGRRRPHPVIIAPMAYQKLAHPEGELATAGAAGTTGTIMCLSTLATTSIRALAQGAPETSRWFQLYVFSDRGVSRELVAQAVEHSYEALVVTADLPVQGFRERDLRTGIDAAPARFMPGAADDAESLMTPADFTAMVDSDLTWDDIERLASDTPLPVIVKGLLTPEDARLAAEHGARGVIVSNHGGRQLDTVLSGADALPAIVDEVADRLDVLVDGGIRRGTDVVKALALGARAVLVGRPLIWGLAVGGADGARRVLEILLEELDRALALAGAPRAEDLDRSFVCTAPWASSAR
jgi:4-hydroxymandelate oxidase